MHPMLPSLLALLVLLPAPAGAAEPAVPPALYDWIPWVLHPQDQRDCPLGTASDGSRICAWPGRLALDLGAQGGTFTQHWQVAAPTWVPLPGDAQTWPQEVRDGDQALPVVLHDGAPATWLAAGAHDLSGRFVWTSPPDGLTVPTLVGLLSLVRDGQPVPFPRVDPDGRLWLADPTPTAGEAGDRLGLTVYRRIDDDLPLRVTTRLELDVAGGARQIGIGPVLLPGAIPLRVQSPLPARIDGETLHVQVRPGHWVLELESQVAGSVQSLARPAAGPDTGVPWPEFEIWSFAARPDLRQVTAGGPPAVDPRQSGVPPDWLELPAYRLEAGQALTLEERRRGNPDPGPDRLRLERDLWLDLNGDGYSLRDRISGTLTRSWRLTATAPLTLGQVQVDGTPRLITRLTEQEAPGVEVRRDRLDLVADSRIEAGEETNPRSLPASGWGLDFNSIHTRLFLPPGWDLLATSGTDNLPNSWIGRWTLLDLFLVLILSLGVGRLWGVAWGLLALTALALTWQVADAPRLVWIAVLIGAALLQLLPVGPPGTATARLRGPVTWYFRLSLLSLVLIGLPFIAGQVRTGLFPHLERPAVGLGVGQDADSAPPGGLVGELEQRIEPAFQAESALDAAPAPASVADESVMRDDADDGIMSRMKSYTTPAKRAPAAPPPDRPDPDALVQSGMGIPDWQWNRFDLVWNGPVAPAETVDLWVLRPGWHLVWSLLGALLTVLLGLRMAGLIGRPLAAGTPDDPTSPPVPPVSRRRDPPAQAGTAALILAAVLGAAALTGPGAAPAGATELPDARLLEELRTRLLTPPDCLPHCVDLADLSLEADPRQLHLTLILDAAVPAAAPVPGGLGGWLPQSIELDGAPLDGLRRGADDQLLVAVPAGRHRLDLSGPLPDAAQLELPLPLPPRQLHSTLTGWTLEGLDPTGRPGALLRLVRVASTGDPDQRPLDQGALPPLLRVERTLRIALDWRVETLIRRLSPAASPVSLPVALLPGESVQTAGIPVQDGQVLVNLAPGETTAGWTSTLEQGAAALRLQAGVDPRLSESWTLDLSPRWHLQWSGPAPINQLTPAERWLPTWRPLPGEALTLTLSRPVAVPGRTLTLDRVNLLVTLGRRASEHELMLRLRGTQGGTFPLTLPDGAEPTRLTSNGLDLPLPRVGAPLEIPLLPGRQSVSVHWRVPEGSGPRVAPVLPELGQPAVNLNLALRVPPERWVLWTSGPRIGPVVVFWGVLVVLTGFAFALGRTRLTPLKTHDWLLLGIGLSLAEIWVLVLVVGWLFALGLRRRGSGEVPRWRYNLTQAALAALTLAALIGLVGAVSQGLLGRPAMQIMGNGSTGTLLNWYQDRTSGALPEISVVSVPMWVYRGLMLGWALWLALRLLRWLRWGWDSCSRPVLWRAAEPRTGSGRDDGPEHPEQC